MVQAPGGGLFFTMFTIVFIVILGTIVFRAVGGISRWQSNNSQPVLTVVASVVAKRTKVHTYTSDNNGQIMNSDSTSYFVTFEFEIGDRLELKVHGSEYGLMVEGDTGRLTFQGTRFLEFSRS